MKIEEPLGGRRRLKVAAAALLMTLGATGLAGAQLLGGGPVPPADVLGGGGVIQAQSPAALAEQSMRMDQMQDQMRQLTGQIEQLTYQVQQLQEALRRTQEDNEFRFQQLEKGGKPQRRSDAGSAATPATGVPPTLGGPAAPPGTTVATAETGGNSDVGAPPTVLGTIPGDGTAIAPPSDSAVGGPLDLSAIARGEDPALAGPILDGGLPGVSSGSAGVQAGTPMDQQGTEPTVPAAGADVAAIAPPTDPKAAYDEAYGLVLSGDYAAAETSFKRFLKDHPRSEQAGSAHFWLGESYFARDKYREAADAFLTTYRDYPKSQKAPESLLKLGLSLEGLGEKDAACATYGELAKKYPGAPATLLDRVTAQRASAGC
ncbi:tol-pal system protein YbgF [Chthonobacter albigriseus]|uniref:tol-pal system protein YbgF n=1 Tax=Chthonobacter albigriseus TaxID=1683161 RepID=UPI0015EE4E99|nr:tol-pal system protein YbgF [Chthonobacter albigriseus]